MSELKKVKGTFLEMFSEIGYNTGKQLWEKLETSQDLDGFIDDLSLEVNKKNLDISFIGSFLEFACQADLPPWFQRSAKKYLNRGKDRDRDEQQKMEMIPQEKEEPKKKNNPEEDLKMLKQSVSQFDIVVCRILSIAQRSPRARQGMEEIVHYIQDQLLSQEMQPIRRHLGWILSECFKLQIKGVIVAEQELEEEVWKQGVQKFLLFAAFLEKMEELDQSSLYQYSYDLFSTHKNAFCWTNKDQLCLMQVLLRNIKGKNIRREKVKAILSQIKPSLVSEMYTSPPTKNFLSVVLSWLSLLSEEDRRGLIKEIRKLIIDQVISLEDKGNAAEGKTYRQQFLEIISKQEYKTLFQAYENSTKPKEETCYECAFLRIRCLDKIPVSAQSGEKISQFLNDEREVTTKIGDENCEVILTCEDGSVKISYRKRNQNLEGLLIPNNIPRNEKVVWRVLQTGAKEWRVIELNEKESKQFADKLKTENMAILNIRSYEVKLEVDTKTLEVVIKGEGEDNKPWEQKGRMFWIPEKCVKQNPTGSQEKEVEADEGLIGPEQTNGEIFEEKNEPDSLLSTEHTYKHLGRLLKHIQVPAEVHAAQLADGSVKVNDLRGKEFVDNWFRNQCKETLKTCFTATDDETEEFEIQGPQEAVKRVSTELNELVGAKVSSAQNNKLKVQKIGQDKNFVVDFSNFLLESEKGREQSVTRKVNVGREIMPSLKSIKSIDSLNEPLSGRSKGTIEIEGETNVSMTGDRGLLKGLLELQEEEMTIAITEIDALNLLNTKDPFLLSDLGLKVNKISPREAQVTGKPVKLIEFQRLLFPYITEVSKNMYENEREEFPIKGAAKNYKLYQSVLQSMPGVDVSIHKSDLLVSVPRKLVPQVIQKIQKEITEKIIEARELSKKKFEFKWVSLDVANAIKKLLKFKLAVIPDDLKGIKPQLEIDELQGQTGFVFELRQGNQQHENIFSDTLKLLVQRFLEYSKLWKGLRKTNDLVNSQLLQLRKVRTSEKDLIDSLKAIIKAYSQHISEQIDYIVVEEQKNLLNKFKASILENKIEDKFIWVPQRTIEKNLQVRNQGVFKSFMKKEIEKQKEKEVVSLAEIKTRIRIIEDIILAKVQQMDQDLIAQKLNPEKVGPLIISIKTVAKLFLTQTLPIIKHLPEFKEMIEKRNTVVVKTGTGSGKSSMLPPFLIAMGFSRVVVTQPRRLPCRALHDRVCSTFFQSLVGYSYAGESSNTHHPLQYMTDGLLKEILKKTPQIIKKIDVLMLDEIHERSRSIDLILLQIRQLRAINPQLKVILCSATVDESIVGLIEQGNNFDTFNVNVQMYDVKEFKIEGMSVIEKANELSSKMDRNDKMLVFFSGVDEVRKNVASFNSRYKKLAYPLFGSQSSKEQDLYIERGQIFFSTSIAETSLTFPGLKYVIDTRKSRMAVFNYETGLTELKEFPSSQSSIKQRRGRVGRDCPGEYYYEDIAEDSKNASLHNSSEIERNDVAQVLFELLQNDSYSTLAKASAALKSLLTDKKNIALIRNLEDGIEMAQTKFVCLKVINKSGEVTKFCKQNLFIYGNLGPVEFNYALHNSKVNGCSYEMIAIISFLMMGTGILESIFQLIPSNDQHPSGDIMTLANFLVKVSKVIDLKNIKEKAIFYHLSNAPELRRKPWLPTLARVMRQMKKLMKVMDVCESRDWSAVEKSLLDKAFANYLYFKEEIMGGRKDNYEKVLEGKTYCFEERNVQKIDYRLDKVSLLASKNPKPDVILSLSTFCNSIESGLMSVCSDVDAGKVANKIKLSIKGTDNKGLNIIDEKALLSSVTDCRESYNWPSLILHGPFNKIVKGALQVMSKRRNVEYVIELEPLLKERIKNLKQDHQDRLTQFFKTINFKDLFSCWKFECDNIYGAKMEFDFGRKTIKLKNAEGKVIHLVLEKVRGFLQWFAGCQFLCIEDMKVPVRQLRRQGNNKNKKSIPLDKIKEIEKRINMIVDSEIQPHIIKSWASSQNQEFKPRTMRMVAVCWVLVNKFHCTIKGGFIRDWVIRGNEWLPAGNLSNLMQVSARNGYIEVNDQRVTPSDIDAQLPLGEFWFNASYFINEMKQLGIGVKIQEDGWRRHILFDEKEKTGGFTVDLIEPYCYISHDQVDFDVNAFYVKKDHLGGLGLKIPMRLRPLGVQNCNQSQVELESLVESCCDFQMRQLKLDIWKDRLEKFQRRGWKISQIVYEPVVYKNYETTYYNIPPEKFNQIFPYFKNGMPTATIVSVEILKNHGWEACYDATLEWIAKETKNKNEKLLFHGASETAINGIYKSGFDGRYIGASHGTWFGMGIYFADDPKLSDSYAAPNSNGVKHMFVCWVALGTQQIMNARDDNKKGPGPGYHSILAKKAPNDPNEYIINRSGQARPIYLIRYRV